MIFKTNKYKFIHIGDKKYLIIEMRDQEPNKVKQVKNLGKIINCSLITK